MKFLIPTEPDDTHAVLVKLALENIGHEVRCLFTADQPMMQKNSVFIDETDYHWQTIDKYDAFQEVDYDVVWWRRARKPHVPKERVHPQDYQFVLRENRLFHESLTDSMASNAWWVNAKAAATRANSKVLQLKQAVSCGLSIPRTLCSNNPQDIRYFLLKHEAEGVVYKPLCSHAWFEEEQMKIAYTSQISFLDLPCNQLLQYTPGIFQKEIKKKYELRVTCFGNYLVAARLNSQAHSEGKIDWRATPDDKLSVEPYTLPAALETKIRAFMKVMGLVFGCIDLIVSESGDYVFLEVNEQGQFLWVEEYCPELPMLDVFVQYLLGQTVDFIWQKEVWCHHIESYRQTMVSTVIQNRRRHIDLNSAAVHNG